MQAVTTATVQFTVNYVPQCFNANDPYSVLSRFIIIKSMPYTQSTVAQVVNDNNEAGVVGLSPTQENAFLMDKISYPPKHN